MLLLGTKQILCSEDLKKMDSEQLFQKKLFFIYLSTKLPHFQKKEKTH
jgi:hypothetical protein